MEKRYDDLVPEKSAILYKKGRTWTRTPPPYIEGKGSKQFKDPSKDKMKVIVAGGRDFKDVD